MRVRRGTRSSVISRLALPWYRSAELFRGASTGTNRIERCILLLETSFPENSLGELQSRKAKNGGFNQQCLGPQRYVSLRSPEQVRRKEGNLRGAWLQAQACLGLTSIYFKKARCRIEENLEVEVPGENFNDAEGNPRADSVEMASQIQ